jgi:predicted pyridoxine 5'-phosphate oxidase superfamily flavin-nucleotide-binding protein
LGLRNLVEESRIGLIFFVPGVNETYRVNGRARISADADLRRRVAVNGKEPATVTVVTVEQAFAHLYVVQIFYVGERIFRKCQNGIRFGQFRQCSPCPLVVG